MSFCMYFLDRTHVWTLVLWNNVKYGRMINNSRGNHHNHGRMITTIVEQCQVYDNDHGQPNGLWSTKRVVVNP